MTLKADAQRMVHGAARDLLLPEPGSEEMGFLARRMMGYEAPSGQEAASALATDVERHRLHPTPWQTAWCERVLEQT